MKQELIKEYKENKKIIKRLNKEEDDFIKKKEEEIKHIEYDIYRKKIRELEEERDNEIEKIRIEIEKRKKEVEQDTNNLYRIIEEVNKILSFFEVLESNCNTKYEVYIYSDKDKKGEYLIDKRKVIIEPIKIIVDDKFKKIGLYIVENKKPKNKYSLIVRGKSIFSYVKDLLENRRYGSYISGIHSEGVTIEMNFKDAPTKEELLKWLNKNEDKILKEFLENHKKLEEGYKEAIKLYEVKEWKILHLEKQKEYYETGYSHGTETKEYKEILKRLKKLTK